MEGTLKFPAGQKRTSPGKTSESADYPQEIFFDRVPGLTNIEGNKFILDGVDDDQEAVVLNGHFYGKGASEMGGVFYSGHDNNQYTGSFGAIRQTAIPSDADKNDNGNKPDDGKKTR